MSEKNIKSNPIFYIVFFILAVSAVYKVFAYGYEKGRFTALYNPQHTEYVAGPEAEQVDLRALRIPTEDLIAYGEETFAFNCASCHGFSGTGDGPKAAGLNPPPRNFTNQEFKFGNSPIQLFNTISKGSPGTSMAPFEFLSEEERFALAHFVRTLVPDPEDDPQELIDALPVVRGGAGSPASAGIPAAIVPPAAAESQADADNSESE